MKVTIIGSGTMGNGIAQVFAQNGYTVSLVDISKDALARATKTIETNLGRLFSKGAIDENVKASALKNISTYTTLADGVAGSTLVIEAASENLQVKLGIFKDLDKLCDTQAILATNTSSISITQIAAATARPGNVIGMHFMNPVPVMKLVEIIRGYNTTSEVTQTVADICRKLGKIPVEVNDYSGFIANRILMPMINEAVYALHEGVAGVEEIDTVMKLGMAHPMGPLQLADFIGLDVCHSILKVMHDGFGNPKYFPCPLLTNMVLAGNLGKKTGSGFYKYSEGSRELIVADFFRKGKELAAE